MGLDSLLNATRGIEVIGAAKGLKPSRLLIPLTAGATGYFRHHASSSCF